MYYLRKEPYETVFKPFARTDGKVIPEHKYMTGDRAIFKGGSKFYRGDFNGIDGRYKGMKVYTCKTLKKILEIQKLTHEYCRETFDVYDENGKVDLAKS